MLLRDWILGFFVLAYAGPALGCGCYRNLNGDTAELVFKGTPVKINHWLRKGDSPGGANSEMARVTFEIAELRKGVAMKKVVVETYTNSCGLRFEIGEEYVVYAYSETDLGIQWAADVCSETARSKPHAAAK